MQNMWIISVMEKTVFCTVLPFFNDSRLISHFCLVMIIENANSMGNLFLTKLNTYIVDFRFKLN